MNKKTDYNKNFKHKILIVDDTEINRFILSDILSNEFTIIEAENGVVALDILSRCKNEIELVLLDIVMPEMDGFDVLKHMKEQSLLEDIPVIMISAENDISIIERAYEMGATDYISRPFDSMIVHRRVLNTILLYAKQKHLEKLVSEQITENYKLYQDKLAMEKATKMKSDFLANMSHEIRTPMNAVLGMADLALRENMSSQARDYIHQIKASGKNLLVIINDILDFSKIESGKMDIIEVEYGLLSVINDVKNIVNNRMGNKEVEFTIDISPDVPQKLYGDNVRIHQIMINILTNAVKFTNKGQVHLKIECQRQDGETVLLKVSVSDTGMGIKKEDLDKLFHSFQQVDSKRNRNIEGTGLGLVISRQLLRLMGGQIYVESEYGKGSTFSFELPQKIINSEPSARKPEREISVAVMIDNPYVKKQILKDLNWLCGNVVIVLGEEDIRKADVDYYIIEKKLFKDSIRTFFAENPEKQCLVIDKFNCVNDSSLPNVRILRKPVYSLSLYNAMGVDSISIHYEDDETDDFFYTAPEANVLIVDDNSINLTVAKGILAPLKMNIDTASSAAEALKMVKLKMYDLIFMDHMMPEVDGVEATKMIRALNEPDYSKVPIIALTANAVGEAKEIFIREGMDDFVAKPIEIKDIVAKIKKWLPSEKIIAVSEPNTDEPKEQKLSINGLNTETAVAMLGSKDLFMTVLKEYYLSIDKKSKVINKYKDSESWREYTIEVHALKSTSRQVGAEHVSELAAELELAGKEGNIKLINEKTDELLSEYLSYKDILKEVFPECSVSEVKKDMDRETLLKKIGDVRKAIEQFDVLTIDDAIEEMYNYAYPEKQNEYLDELKEAAEQSDLDRCSELLDLWEKETENFS